MFDETHQAALFKGKNAKIVTRLLSGNIFLIAMNVWIIEKSFSEYIGNIFDGECLVNFYFLSVMWY